MVREVTVKPDPKILESLEAQAKSQQQLAGNIDGKLIFIFFVKGQGLAQIDGGPCSVLTPGG